MGVLSGIRRDIGVLPSFDRGEILIRGVLVVVVAADGMRGF